MTSKLKIIVTGLIAQHPTLGGVAWDYIQYVAGLANLGHDVFYIEDSGQWPYQPDGGATGDDWIARDPSANVAYLAHVFSQFGLDNRWAYRFPMTATWYGLSDASRDDVVSTADLLINVSGTLEDPERYRRVKRLAYIDSDPVFTQVKLASNDTEFQKCVDAHDVHFSFGECFSNRVPLTNYEWLPTRTPIVMSQWRQTTPSRNMYTTVMNWTSYPPLEFQGRSYGQKDVELLRFVDLPGRVPAANLEVALSPTQHVNWQSEARQIPLRAKEWLSMQSAETKTFQPADLLAHMGWHVVNAGKVGGDPQSYRHYIEASRAEWSIAKQGYVTGQAGWFSCRTACYLAAGRPAVVQDTGFTSVIPTGQGLIAFRTMDDAIAAIDEIETNYERHSRAARELASEYFSSDNVLPRLIEDAFSFKATTTNGQDDSCEH